MNPGSRNRTQPAAPELKRALFQIATEAAELKATVGGGLTEIMADWLAPRYAVAAQEQLANAPDPEARWPVLRMVAMDWCALRRGDQGAERLRLQRERLELLREQVAAEPGSGV